ncbi:gfo/Idh/MocA family oxidoreductase [Anaerobacillus alkaliphilus]|uniref:Gfo/Idh/MocA family oxidoreductase n=1 Tax=Anaerobacillus alkaliphilus TaxID=1548597 RepID=A0A4Q0VNM2_9BACI|nr:Gfo/Idh/MocA family oxidoreductase [Anaerobacillus alkaliphilus]RXI96460.1 gfo/Idh/MocA family oxidoreductase [Anaerobacillus alkaliphilus]
MTMHKIMLIGHGGISSKYLQAFSTVPNTKIVGVVGRSPERVKDFGIANGIQVYGTAIEEVAKNSGATAAVILTPNALHYHGVMEASRLGLHCLCEKPLHISREKQVEMINSCKTNNVKLAVSYMRRFIPHFVRIKELIDSGKLGRLLVVDASIKNYRDKEYYSSWHGTNDFDGGGPFIQQGSHMVDLVLWLTGGYQKVLEARRFQVYHEIETEDHGYAVVRYKNGAVGMITASTATPGLNTEFIEISGTKGSIRANYQKILDWNVEGFELPTNIDRKNNFEKLVEDFISSIETGSEPFVTGESAKTATELVMDIYEKAGDPLKLTD